MIIAEQHAKVMQNMPVEQALRKSGRRRIGRAGKVFPGLVISVTASSLGGISRHDLPLVSIDEQSNQQRVLSVILGPLTRRGLLPELHLDAFPQILVHDRIVLPVMGVALVNDLTPVNRILEQVEQAAPPERDAAAMRTAYPALHLGDDAFRSKLHKRPAVRDRIEAAGPTLRFLPPYSPDFNPIEKAFSRLKAMLRKIGERTVRGLWSLIGKLVDIFQPAECANYFSSCGYDPN